MGVIKRGILGGVSGRVGNIVGSSWKGIAYLKSLPLSVANPRTSGQVSARSALTYITQNFSPSLTTIIQPLWNRWAVQMSGFNHFVKTNVSLFAGGDFTSFANFKLSVGKLLGIDDLAVIADRSGNSIDLTFTDNSGTGNAVATDIAFVVVYNATKDTWLFYMYDWDRAGGQVNIEMPAAYSVADALKIYLSFRSIDGYLVSNSQYIAVAVVA